MLFRKKPSYAEILERIEDSIAIFQKRSQNYELKSLTFRNAAKQHLRIGQRELARSSLKRWYFYHKFADRYMNYAQNLESRLMAIQEAQAIGDLKRAIQLTGQALESVQTNNKQLLEMMIRQEEIMRELDQAADMLAAGEEDFDVTEELNKLEAEIALEETLGAGEEVPAESPQVEEREEEEREAEKT